MKIDVLLPTRGSHLLLEVALKSLRHQTFRKFRVLILDNSKDESSRAYIRSLSEGDDRFEWIPLEFEDGEQASLGRLLNIGLKYCNSEFVARQDDDDFSLPLRFEDQLKLMANGVDICGTQGIYLHESGRYRSTSTLPTRRAEIASCMPFMNPIIHTSALIRRTTIEALGGYAEDLKHGQDLDLWNRARYHGFNIANSSGIRVMLTLRQGSITNTTIQADQRVANSEILNRIGAPTVDDKDASYWRILVNLPALRGDLRSMLRMLMCSPLSFFKAGLRISCAEMRGRMTFLRYKNFLFMRNEAQK